jgi:hypothetical protein
LTSLGTNGEIGASSSPMTENVIGGKAIALPVLSDYFFLLKDFAA